MCHSARILFIAAILPVRHMTRASWWQHIAVASQIIYSTIYNLWLRRRHIGSECHTRHLTWSASKNCGHSNIRETRRVPHLYIPNLCLCVVFTMWHILFSPYPFHRNNLCNLQNHHSATLYGYNIRLYIWNHPVHIVIHIHPRRIHHHNPCVHHTSSLR